MKNCSVVLCEVEFNQKADTAVCTVRSYITISKQGSSLVSEVKLKTSYMSRVFVFVLNK